MPESSKVSFVLGVVVGALFSGLVLWAVKWAIICVMVFIIGCMIYAAWTGEHEDA